MKKTLVLTPLPYPIQVELGGQGDILARALTARIAGRNEPVLDTKDTDFVTGIAAVYGLRCAGDLLKALEANRRVRIEVIEETEKK